LEKIQKLDYDAIQKKIGSFLVDEVSQRDALGVVFGLSGGIDSAVIAMLCTKFLKDKSLALIMPDSKATPKIDTEDAINLVDKLGIDYKLIDIGLISKEYSKYLEPNSFAFGNLSARIRANILYYYANAKKYLVLGSSDKSEFLIGYFTKFGDGAADLLPIASMYKTQIRQLAKFLGIPDSILTKKSSPGLWEGHLAETEIGMNYEEIDIILYCIVEKNFSTQQIANFTGIDKSSVDKIHKMYKNSEHKRITAKICQT
jgi:NAD+ synthase